MLSKMYKCTLEEKLQKRLAKFSRPIETPVEIPYKISVGNEDLFKFRVILPTKLK